METVNGTQRQSGIRSIINWDLNDEKRDFTFSSSTSVNPSSTSKMAAAVAINSSSSSYSSYSTDPPSRYEVASSAFNGRSSSLHNLISYADSRWPSERHNNAPQLPPSQNRLSLPSIHEALRPKPNYDIPAPPNLSPSQDQMFPRSITPNTPRNYPSAAIEQPPQFTSNGPPNPSQHPHAQRSSFSRSLEPINMPFPDLAKHPVTSTATSQKSYNSRAEVKRFDHEFHGSDRPMSEHSHQSSTNHHAYDSSRTSSMPPSSSQNNASAFAQPEFPAREYLEPPEPWRKVREEEKPDMAGKFRGGIKRNLDVWEFENNLAEINMSSSALQEWSAHYNAIAQDKQYPSSTLSDRMPSIDSLKEIRRHQQKIFTCLEHLTRIINEADQQKERALVEKRSQEKTSRPGDTEEDTVLPTHVEEPRNQGFVSEAKKRRGRAAPPGRCHSCNRAETPEWRRGPDGARTLCNACGLHYAKLTRKNMSNKSFQSFSNPSLRPKSLDISPRTL